MPDVERWTNRFADVGGLEVERALPKREHRTVGPWCFLDHMGPAAPPAEMRVGPHPHTGLQTVTWLLEGEVLHTDSLGSEQLIRPGQLNLMSAGRGVAHAEQSTRSSGTMHGAQLWVAQPEATRHGPASFEHHAELPEVELGTGRATVLLGSLAGASPGSATSPGRADSPIVGADLDLPEGRYVLPLDETFEHGLSVLSGALAVDGEPFALGAFAYLGTGRSEVVLTVGQPTRALLVGGEPFPEDVVMWWNFVARTTDELDRARADWEAGSDRFGPVRSPLDRIPAPAGWWQLERSRGAASA